MKKLFVLFTFLSLSIIGASSILGSNHVSALSGSEFNAGRIIDDFVYFRSSDLAPADIQNFLNAKVPVCDTWGTQPRGNTTRAQYGTSVGNPPPYTCLKDFRQDTPTKPAETGLCNGFSAGNKSAAEIIYDVSVSCRVNPRVLLVLLQKEQSLVTDDWPWAIQYRSATGYGCPDTAPCDAEYYGFFNQVYNAARQSKRYVRDAELFRYRAGRDNYIQYNPNISCGGTNVYIQNSATAVLYNYTPYQPNASALANLYGSGDNCGAYGNRNFWRLWRDWFGLTYANDTDVAHPNGTVVGGQGKVWLIDNNQKKHVITPNIFSSYNYRWDRVKFASYGDMSLPTGPSIDSLAPGTIFRSDNTPVYAMVIDGGYLKKKHLSLNAFNAMGYSWEDVMYVPPHEVTSLTAEGIQNDGLHPTGTAITVQSEGKVYLIDSGTRRHILGPVSFSSNNLDWNRVKQATAEDIALPVGPPLDLRPGTILNANGIYVVEYDANGILRRPVGPWECYSERLHYTPDDWTYVLISSLPVRSGPIFTC